MVKRKIVILGRTDWFLNLFDECKNDNDVIIGEEEFINIKGSLKYFFYKLAFTKKKTNKIVSSFFAKKFSHSICEAIKKRCEDNTVFILNRTTPLSSNEYFLARLRNINNTYKLVYWFTDIVNNVSVYEKNIIEICKQYYDYIITYDPLDAEKYGFHYVETPYSFNRKANLSNEIDLFYVGAAKIETDKSRYDKILNVFKEANNIGLNVEFYITGVPDEKKIINSHIHYITYLPYDDVVKKLCKARCILEVQQEGERGTTLRLFEAIAYKKKLLVTSDTIMSHQLFDNTYMKLIRKNQMGDYMIDKEFIQNDKKVEYSETSVKELSPYRFINQVLELLN